MIAVRAGDEMASNIRVWLNGEEKTSQTFYGLLPENPGEACEGELGMYAVDSEGRFITLQREGQEPVIAEVWKTGVVRWEYVSQ